MDSMIMPYNFCLSFYGKMNASVLSPFCIFALTFDSCIFSRIRYGKEMILVVADTFLDQGEIETHEFYEFSHHLSGQTVEDSYALQAILFFE
jgi:hypothetical protein